MCIIIANPPDEVIKTKDLEQAAEENPDGYGIAFVKDSKIIIYKTMKAREFIESYQTLKQDNIQSPFLLHARIGTQGQKNLENCHPFQVNESLVFCHNGIISKYSSKEFRDTCPNQNDTMIFNDIILKNLQPDFYLNPALQSLIEDYIGWSKLAFLDNTGKIKIFNEHRGHKDMAGNWYSNDSYQKKKSYVRYYDEDFPVIYKPCPHCQAKLITKTEIDKNACYKCMFKKVKKDDSKYNTCPNHPRIYLQFKEEHRKGFCITCLMETVCDFCGNELVYPQELAEKLCFTCMPYADFRSFDEPTRRNYS
jgi:glutamine amidotransferase